MQAFSYVASFIATVLGLIEPFGKKMKTILTLNFTGNLLVCISYFCTGSNSGAAICALACVQVLINYFFDAKKKRVPLWLIIIYSLAFTGVNLLNFNYWYDALSLIAALLFVISVAQSSSKHYRVLYFLNSAVWIGYDFLSGAYANLGTHIALVIATLGAIIIRDFKQKKQ